MSVGAAIYARRLEKGLTQRELARRAVMTPANLSAIETGRRDLLVSTLLRIARCELRPCRVNPSQPERFTRGKSALGILNRFGDFFSTLDSQGTELGHPRIE